jgi:phosphoribulokinase
VKQIFEQIFRREKITAAFIEGDAFHRYDRAAMKKKVEEEAGDGNPYFTHFHPEANELEILQEVFKEFGENGTGRTRHYVHDDKEAKLYGKAPGQFTDWGPFGENELLFYEGLHGCAVTDKVDLPQFADLRIGVVLSSIWSGFRRSTAIVRPAAIRRRR